jgi:hypothetical protein
MNYIKHLNAVFLQFSKDNRLNPSHISLYIGLFQIWNYSRFPEEFYINREEVMEFSKIGSKSTYHRCIRELDSWKYLMYKPSHNPFKGSRVLLFQFEISDERGLDLPLPKSEQALVSVININKHDKHDENIKKTFKREILFFFKEKQWPKTEAEKFFNHYEAVGWKKGINPIENWKAASENWMLKFKEISSSRAESRDRKNAFLPPVQNKDNLHTNRNKNYNEPL